MNITVILGIIGALSFVVSLITEIIKDIGALDKIRTGWVVLVLSLILTPVAYLIYVSVANQPILWYEIVLSIIGGFIVAYVSMYGWDKLKDLWNNKKHV